MPEFPFFTLVFLPQPVALFLGEIFSSDPSDLVYHPQ
jgi:hypothetical protein